MKCNLALLQSNCEELRVGTVRAASDSTLVWHAIFIYVYVLDM